MSLDFNVYCKEVSADLIPKIVKRLNDFDMVVDVHPDFTFDEEKDCGFLPFKFRLKNPDIDALKDKDLKSGFELYIEDFNLQKTKDELKPKQSFFDKLLGKKQPDIAFASSDIEKRLKYCKKVIIFVWHTGDIFQLRFASLTSAILTEITNGVCCYLADDIWYDNKNIVENAFNEAKKYEQSVKKNDFEFYEFDEW